jgi:hypothetical protein
MKKHCGKFHTLLHSYVDSRFNKIAYEDIAYFEYIKTIVIDWFGNLMPLHLHGKKYLM